ncbi:MAG: hypothetical protein MJA27_28375, partial [Pseudanabaenales cyanobacterium]|nr:hypothetical protein [Pseudanabaenales cyanobacterium]
MGSQSNSSINNVLQGSIYSDVLIGEDLNNEIQGYEGNDLWLSGEAGLDLIAGGAGNDILSGGGGNDLLHGDFEKGSGWTLGADGEYHYTAPASTTANSVSVVPTVPELSLD